MPAAINAAQRRTTKNLFTYRSMEADGKRVLIPDYISDCPRPISKEAMRAEPEAVWSSAL